VVRPRLTDAEFFFKQDKKQKLEDFNLRLQNVVFQEKLGSVYDKAERVSKLAAFIAQRIGGNAAWASRAGLLSKCDLATEMVGEFPEMQGVAGYYYALNDGEPEEVALALNEQYMPRGAGAELPTTLTGAAVAIADKLDTLVGIFGIGMLPTGSKDPYALRRAALGVLRILIDKKLDLDLNDAVAFAVNAFGAKVKTAGLNESVLEFIFDRLRARYEDEGVDVATYLSVRALKPGSALDFDQRVQAVQAFRKLPEAAALAAVNKRVSNLISKAEPTIFTDVDPGLFADAKEFSLNSAIMKAENAVKPLMVQREYAEALARLASLREPVDAFFEAVMINAEDLNVRKNRYAMLARLRGLFLNIADISVLS
jgi:glycyl-tRNA synthetase beta chain